MKTVQEQIAVMQAFADGKKIEYYSPGCDEWIQTNRPTWNWAEYYYRVKPGRAVLYVNQYESGAWGVGHESRAQATRTAAGSNATMCRVGVKFIEAPNQGE